VTTATPAAARTKTRIRATRLNTGMGSLLGFGSC
jgi:hypothetical protein